MANEVNFPDGKIIIASELAPYKPGAIPTEPFQTVGDIAWWWKYERHDFFSPWYGPYRKGHSLYESAVKDFDSAESFYNEYRTD